MLLPIYWHCSWGNLPLKMPRYDPALKDVMISVQVGYALHDSRMSIVKMVAYEATFYN